MKKFNRYIKELKKNNTPIIISGDFNVIPTDDDVYSPENFKNDACAHPLTREQYRILINMGFTDLVKHFVEGKTESEINGIVVNNRGRGTLQWIYRICQIPRICQK